MDKSKSDKKPDQLSYIAIGIVLGVGAGTSLGVAFDNIAIGISLGIVIGLSAGVALH